MRYTARSALGSDSLGSQVHVNLPHQACRFLKRLLPHHHLKTFSDRVSNSLGPQEVLDPPQEFLINFDRCFHVAVSRQTDIRHHKPDIGINVRNIRELSRTVDLRK